MAYRKITVNDKTYEYVVGKTHTKVKGVGVALNVDIGHDMPSDGFDQLESYNIVTPFDIKKFILSQGA